MRLIKSLVLCLLLTFGAVDTVRAQAPANVQSAPLTISELTDLRRQLAEALEQERRASGESRAAQAALRRVLERNTALQQRVQFLEAQLAPATVEAPAGVTAVSGNSDSLRLELAALVLSDDANEQAALAAIQAGRFAEGFELLEADARAASQRADASRDPGAIADASSRWRRLGELTATRDQGRAMSAYREALRLDPNDAGAAAALISLHTSRGELAEAVLLAPRLERAAQSLMAQIDVHSALRDIATLRGDATEARRRNDLSLAAARRMVAEEPGDEADRMLSAALDWVASDLVRQGRAGEALPLALEANQIDERRYNAQPNDRLRKIYLAVGLGRLDEIYGQLGERARARTARERWRDLLVELVRDDPSDLFSSNYLAVIYGVDAYDAIQAEQWRAALAAGERAVALRERIIAAEPENYGFLDYFASDLASLSLAQARLRRFDDALASAERAVSFAERTPPNNAYRARIVRTAGIAVSNLQALSRRDRRVWAAADALRRRLSYMD